ncbi:MAG: CPBP family intramembrane glutamic endopeptidase [Pseudomonadota bacterium]
MIFYAAATQPTINGVLAQRSAAADVLYQQGTRWPAGEPAALVGGAPVGDRSWRFQNDQLEIEAGPGSIYLPLQFAGRRLNAVHLRQLDITYQSAADVTIVIYHRSELAGPAARGTALRLPAGQTRFSVDLAALAWTIDGETVSWGQGSRAVATLRLHPLNRSAPLLLEEITLRPAPAPGPRPEATVTWLDGKNLVLTPTSQRLEVPTTWLRVGDVRHHLAAQDRAPGMSSVERTGWQPLPGTWAGALAILGAAALLLTARRRPAVALTLFAALVWLSLSAVSWQAVATGAGISALGALALIAGNDSGVGARQQGGWWLLLIGLALLSLSFALTGADALPSARQVGIYILWATLQQTLLCRVVWPLARRSAGRETLAITIAALLFGWAHLPNLELMVLTFVLGLVTVAHFRRYRALAPVIGFHFLAGLALVLNTPNALIYSTSVGPSFWS